MGLEGTEKRSPFGRQLEIQDSSSGVGSGQTELGDRWLPHRSLISVMVRLPRNCCCRQRIWSKRVKQGSLRNTVTVESSKGGGKPSKPDGEVGAIGRKPETNRLVKVRRQESLEKWEVVNSFNK